MNYQNASISNGSLYHIPRFLRPVVWNKKVLHNEKKTPKMSIKSVNIEISRKETKKMGFFLMSQGSLNPKIRFLGQKVCSVAC